MCRKLSCFILHSCQIIESTNTTRRMETGDEKRDWGTKLKNWRGHWTTYHRFKSYITYSNLIHLQVWNIKGLQYYLSKIWRFKNSFEPRQRWFSDLAQVFLIRSWEIINQQNIRICRKKHLDKRIRKLFFKNIFRLDEIETC